MSPFVYALNIATLALWLSVAGLDVVGWVMPVWHAEPKSSRAGETAAVLPPPEVSLGAPEPSDAAAAPSPDMPEAPEPEAVPEPPELPALAEFAPLPEITDLAPTRPEPAAKPAASNVARPTRRAEHQPTARPGTAADGGSSSMSAAARLAAGKMPAPMYPLEARRKGQSGTVLVEFVIGADGRVLSAYAKEPSPWPLLNNEAVSTVRRWKFPPGGVMKQQRQIDFQLQ